MLWAVVRGNSHRLQIRTHISFPRTSIYQELDSEDCNHHVHWEVLTFVFKCVNIMFSLFQRAFLATHTLQPWTMHSILSTVGESIGFCTSPMYKYPEDQFRSVFKRDSNSHTTCHVCTKGSIHMLSPSIEPALNVNFNIETINNLILHDCKLASLVNCMHSWIDSICTSHMP